MDFLSTFKMNFEKLKNKNIVNILWKEILNEERSEEYSEQLIEYSFHYPVDTDAYLQELQGLFDGFDKKSLRDIDGHLKAYIITFLYYCTNKYSKRVPIQTTILASTLYIKLISIPSVGKLFFEKNMFKVQLFVCINAVKVNSIAEGTKLYLLKLIKKYCLQGQLDDILLQTTANTLVCIAGSCHKDLTTNLENVNPLTLFCLNSLREMILLEQNGHRLTCLGESLFRCLRQSVNMSFPNKDATLGLIKIFTKEVLQNQLDEDKFQYMLNAFCRIWSRDDFSTYAEAVALMNILKVQYYKELMRRMVMYSQSKNHKHYLINIMRLLYLIAKSLPTFPLDKIEVFYTCTVRNIIFHFIDKDKKIASKAIETISDLCLLKDNPLLTLVFNESRGIGKFISVEAILLSFNKILDEKWGTSSRNQHLLIIMSRFLTYYHNVNIELVKKTLQTICKDCTPFALKPSLPVLHELFYSMALKDQNEIAEEILKIMFKNAMHQDATSSEFSNHIFDSLLKPSVIGNITYSPKYYYNIFLTSEFDYEALFIKCQKKIRNTHVTNIISQLNYNEPGGAILLCCLLQYCQYEETTVLANYIIDNFHEISIRPIMGPFAIAFAKVLETKTINDDDIPQLDVMQSLIMEALFDQSFLVSCLKPAYDLFQVLRSVLNIDTEDQVLDQLMNMISEKAFKRLHQREAGDDSVIMYLNELCLLLKRLPSENVLSLLESYMANPAKVQTIRKCMPDVYLQLITLFTTIGMMKKSKITQVVQYLKEALKYDTQIIKILGFKLYYSLCQEITHEFDEVLRFAFKEVVMGDPCLVRICIIALEEIIHNDYIKLSSDNFFRFIYVLGCEDLCIFMKEILKKRFILSNQHDIAKYFLQTIVYINTYSRLPNYPIPPEFDEDLIRIKFKMNNPKEISMFLFNTLPVKKKFKVLSEISCILDSVLKGNCKIENNFFNLVTDLLLPFKLIATTHETPLQKNYYNTVCKQIEKQIIVVDASYKVQCYYAEFMQEIKHCTLIMLQLLFFENTQLADKIQNVLFDVLMNWIPFVKSEIIHYIHVEKGKEFGSYFQKLLQYYKTNKTRINAAP